MLNESVLNGSIYGFTSSPTSEKNNQIVNLPHFPIEVPLNDSIEFQFKVAGGECSDVFFYTLGKEEKNIPEATVFCLRNDTTDVWVSF